MSRPHTPSSNLSLSPGTLSHKSMRSNNNYGSSTGFTRNDDIHRRAYSPTDDAVSYLKSSLQQDEEKSLLRFELERIRQDEDQRKKQYKQQRLELQETWNKLVILRTQMKNIEDEIEDIRMEIVSKEEEQALFNGDMMLIENNLAKFTLNNATKHSENLHLQEKVAMRDRLGRELSKLEEEAVEQRQNMFILSSAYKQALREEELIFSNINSDSNSRYVHEVELCDGHRLFLTSEQIKKRIIEFSELIDAQQLKIKERTEQLARVKREIDEITEEKRLSYYSSVINHSYENALKKSSSKNSLTAMTVSQNSVQSNATKRNGNSDKHANSSIIKHREQSNTEVEELVVFDGEKFSLDLIEALYTQVIEGNPQSSRGRKEVEGGSESDLYSRLARKYRVEEIVKFSIDEVIQNEAKIFRVNGETAEHYLPRLEKRLFALHILEGQILSDFQLRIEDLKKMKNLLREKEVHRLKLEMKMMQMEYGKASSTSEVKGSHLGTSKIEPSNQEPNLPYINYQKYTHLHPTHPPISPNNDPVSNLTSGVNTPRSTISSKSGGNFNSSNFNFHTSAPSPHQQHLQHQLEERRRIIQSLKEISNSPDSTDIRRRSPKHPARSSSSIHERLLAQEQEILALISLYLQQQTTVGSSYPSHHLGSDHPSTSTPFANSKADNERRLNKLKLLSQLVHQYSMSQGIFQGQERVGQVNGDGKFNEMDSSSRPPSTAVHSALPSFRVQQTATLSSAQQSQYEVLSHLLGSAAATVQQPPQQQPPQEKQVVQEENSHNVLSGQVNTIPSGQVNSEPRGGQVNSAGAMDEREIALRYLMQLIEQSSAQKHASSPPMTNTPAVVKNTVNFAEPTTTTTTAVRQKTKTLSPPRTSTAVVAVNNTNGLHQQPAPVTPIREAQHQHPTVTSSSSKNSAAELNHEDYLHCKRTSCLACRARPIQPRHTIAYYRKLAMSTSSSQKAKTPNTDHSDQPVAIPPTTPLTQLTSPPQVTSHELPPTERDTTSTSSGNFNGDLELTPKQTSTSSGGTATAALVDISSNNPASNPASEQLHNLLLAQQREIDRLKDFRSRVEEILLQQIASSNSDNPSSSSDQTHLLRALLQSLQPNDTVKLTDTTTAHPTVNTTTPPRTTSERPTVDSAALTTPEKINLSPSPPAVTSTSSSAVHCNFHLLEQTFDLTPRDFQQTSMDHPATSKTLLAQNLSLLSAEEPHFDDDRQLPARTSRERKTLSPMRRSASSASPDRRTATTNAGQLTPESSLAEVLQVLEKKLEAAEARAKQLAREIIVGGAGQLSPDLAQRRLLHALHAVSLEIEVVQAKHLPTTRTHAHYLGSGVTNSQQGPHGHGSSDPYLELVLLSVPVNLSLLHRQRSSELQLQHQLRYGSASANSSSWSQSNSGHVASTENSLMSQLTEYLVDIEHDLLSRHTCVVTIRDQQSHAMSQTTSQAQSQSHAQREELFGECEVLHYHRTAVLSETCYPQWRETTLVNDVYLPHTSSTSSTSDDSNLYLHTLGSLLSDLPTTNSPLSRPDLSDPENSRLLVLWAVVRDYRAASVLKAARATNADEIVAQGIYALNTAVLRVHEYAQVTAGNQLSNISPRSLQIPLQLPHVLRRKRARARLERDCMLRVDLRVFSHALQLYSRFIRDSRKFLLTHQQHRRQSAEAAGDSEQHQPPLRVYQLDPVVKQQCQTLLRALRVRQPPAIGHYSARGSATTAGAGQLDQYHPTSPSRLAPPPKQSHREEDLLSSLHSSDINMLTYNSKNNTSHSSTQSSSQLNLRKRLRSSPQPGDSQRHQHQISSGNFNFTQQRGSASRDQSSGKSLSAARELHEMSFISTISSTDQQLHLSHRHDQSHSLMDTSYVSYTQIYPTSPTIRTTSSSTSTKQSTKQRSRSSGHTSNVHGISGHSEDIARRAHASYLQAQTQPLHSSASLSSLSSSLQLPRPASSPRPADATETDLGHLIDRAQRTFKPRALLGNTTSSTLTSTSSTIGTTSNESREVRDIDSGDRHSHRVDHLIVNSDLHLRTTVDNQGSFKSSVDQSDASVTHIHRDNSRTAADTPHSSSQVDESNKTVSFNTESDNESDTRDIQHHAIIWRKRSRSEKFSSISFIDSDDEETHIQDTHQSNFNDTSSLDLSAAPPIVKQSAAASVLEVMPLLAKSKLKSDKLNSIRNPSVGSTTAERKVESRSKVKVVKNEDTPSQVNLNIFRASAARFQHIPSISRQTSKKALR